VRAFQADLKLVADPNGQSPQMAREFIEAVTAAGDRVLIVSVPKSNELEERLPSVDAVALSAARSLQAENPSVSVAVFPTALPDQFFCDVTHLGPRGTEAYSRWLVDQLASTQIATNR
jgi:hypothetical protein